MQCLACSHDIKPGEETLQVKMKWKAVRYRHASDEDCRRNLGWPDPLTQGMRKDRLDSHSGHVTNLPGLDDMEQW